MKKIFLRGLAEGMAGRSFVEATGVDDVFVQFPSLCMIREKLVITEDTVSGFCACDG